MFNVAAGGASKRCSRILAVVTGFLIAAVSAAPAQQLQPRSPGVQKSLQQMQALPNTGRVIVKFREGNAIRLRDSRLAGMADNDAQAFSSALARFGVAPGAITRTFTRPEAELDAERSAGQQQSGRALADLNLYYTIVLPPGVSAADVAAELNTLPNVEFAEPALAPPPPPVDIAPVTPDLTGNQGYKSAAPTGIGSLDATTFPGSDGTNVQFADVEYAWQLDHEDLELPANRVLNVGSTAVDPFNDTNHGTAVLGQIVGEKNAYGVTGIAPAAFAKLAPANTTAGYNPANAISAATANLAAGDVILIEQQAPACGGVCGGNQVGCGPAEASQTVFDATLAASTKGIIVVATAGNGDVNLDAPACGTAFNRSVRDSLAVMVGAGSSTTHSRLSFSTYGSRLDVQGWGENITSTGYGDAFNPGDIRQRYTAVFGGTSGAGPIVSGVVLSVQGRLKACGMPPATPAAMRAALLNGATPQGNPVSEKIGPLPTVAGTLAALGVSGACPAPPANDNFANAITISGATGTTTGSNLTATHETGEPAHYAGTTGTRSIWWRWTAPATGQATVDTSGSGIDTVLAIYAGASVSALTQIVSNDDTGGTKQSRVGFHAVSGATYYVAVDGKTPADGGAVTLNWNLNASQGPVSLLASVLPYARSVQVGQPATAFATILNTGSAAATKCSLQMPRNQTVPGTFQYQTASPANTLTGTLNTPVDIPAGGGQQWVFGVTPSAAFSATDIRIVFDCENTQPVESFDGLNTFLVSASVAAVPDMIAISATASNNGILEIPGATGTQAFGTAAINIGAAGAITASVDTGSTTLPLNLTICQSTGAGTCMAAPAASVTTTIANNQTVTYSIFGTATAAIALDPSQKRIFLRLKTGDGVTRGATSVAVRTQ